MKEYINNLQMYANRFQEEMEKRGFNANYKVENIWIDYGAKWRDNTLVVYFDNKEGQEDSFQILSPRDIREIKENKFSEEDFCRILDKHTQMFERYSWGK